MTQHSCSRIVMTLATHLYEDDDHKAAAIGIVKSIIASGRRNQPSAQVTSSQSTTQESFGTTASTPADKIAHNMTMSLKDRDKKFSGDAGECREEYVDEYRQVSRDYKLNRAQKPQNLHDLLPGDVKRFYPDTVEGYDTNFEQAISMIEREYSSIIRQNKVKNF